MACDTENLTTYTVGNTRYFYQPCVHDRNESYQQIRHCFNCNKSSNNTLLCAQFCDEFERILPHVYLSVSCLSALCCLGVFSTYFLLPRLRQSGYSSKVFLYRTLVDFVIALGHITAGIFHLSKAEDDAHQAGCKALGVVNEVALVASNLWYVMLAIDLLKAIRNPFSSQPSYKWLSNVIVWGFSLFCGAVLAALTITHHPGEAGQSMFYWCWVSTSVNRKYWNKKINVAVIFSIVTLFLYYLWHFVFWIFSLCLLIAAAWILRGHLAASSETRKFVLKQNFIYVLVLGTETALIMPIWITQFAVIRQAVWEYGRSPNRDKYFPYYFTYSDLGLAIAFAVIHSSRGAIDFFVWLGTFMIGWSDIKELRYRLKKKISKRRDGLIASNLHSPLIGQKDSTVNRALRRNAMYCINIGILDAVTLHLEHQQRVSRVGLVDDSFVAAAMMNFDKEKQENRTAELYKNPNYREQTVRKIQFPASSSLHIPGFSFIDLEPSVFNMLRSSYGIDPRNYRTSFKIKNAADIESSGMLEKFTEGKSGSFFYFTRDFKYIIKTVTDEEERFLQKIAYRYYDHMKNNPNSLIVRFFGLHKVRLAKEQRFITVVVMENIFHNTDQFKMHERYDLKGSHVGRRAAKKTSKVTREYKGTLKDLDLGNKKICVGADSKAQLLEQLRRDVEFLIQCKIMDYSLLLGIHNHSPQEKTDRRMVREGSVRGMGDDFVKVDIRNIGEKSCTGTDIPMTSFRERLSSGKSSGYNTRSNTLDSADEASHTLGLDEEDVVESQFQNSTQQEKIAWFREDFGGLRSSSTSHPLYREELQLHGPNAGDGLIEQLDIDVPSATYYFGIVDILQQYNWQKKSEYYWKTKVACKDKHGISCVNEHEYGERFLGFMDEIFQ